MKSRLLLAFLMPLLAGCSTIDPCEITPLQTVTSPDKKHKLVVYSRGCGATTDEYTEISLLKADEPTADDVGNVLSLDDNGEGNVTVHWQNNSNVRLSYSAKTVGQPDTSNEDGVQIHLEH